MAVLQLVVSKEDFLTIDKMRLEYTLKNDLQSMLSRSSFLNMILKPALESFEKDLKE
jgi:hypothetical protein